MCVFTKHMMAVAQVQVSLSTMQVLRYVYAMLTSKTAKIG